MKNRTRESDLQPTIPIILVCGTLLTGSSLSGQQEHRPCGGHAPRRSKAKVLVRTSFRAYFKSLQTYLDTLALGQADPGLLATDDEDVALTGGELVVNSVLDVDNVETTIVTLTVGDDTNTAHITTTSDHGNDASVELDEVGDLAGGEINLDGVVDLDQRVGVADAVSHSVSIPIN